jgi:hypothetical protein
MGSCRMKKALSLLLLAIAPLGAALDGCTEDKDKCSSNQPDKFYDLQGLTLAAIRPATGQSVTAGETVTAAEVLLEIKHQVRYHATQPVRAGWLPAAYACPPTPYAGYKGTTEILDSLVVRSVFVYDASHPAGAAINDLLLEKETGKPLPPVPAQHTSPALYGLQLRFRQAPAQAGPQQFVVRYRLTNGETYSARTPVFTLR